MPIRSGSLGAELEALDPEVLEALLADYEQSEHRAHCSRKDFAAGWIAHAQRMGFHVKRTEVLDWGELRVA